MRKYRMLSSFNTREERVQYMEEALLQNGLRPLEVFGKIDTPMEVEILEGRYKGYLATIRWSNFIYGRRPDFRSLLNKHKFLRDKFEEEGYTVVRIPDNVTSSSKIDLISPEGNEWSVAYPTFRSGVRCPTDSNKSWGERCVASVLKQNNIPFKSQKTIWHEDGSRQYMDFYVKHKGREYDIEYHGRQHYGTDPDNRLFLPAEEQKERDAKKQKYCELNDITYVVIPFSKMTVSDVAKELHKSFAEIDLHKSYIVESFNYDREIAEYFMRNTEKETAKKFNISGSKVRKTAYKLGYRKNKRPKKEEAYDDNNQ